MIRETAQTKLCLGSLQLAGDLQNQHGLQVRASTVRQVKRRIPMALHSPPARLT